MTPFWVSLARGWDVDFLQDVLACSVQDQDAPRLCHNGDPALTPRDGRGDFAGGQGKLGGKFDAGRGAVLAKGREPDDKQGDDH